MSNLGKLNILIGANAENFYKAVGGVENSIRNIQKTMGKTAAIMSAAVSLPLIALGAASVRASGDFEQEMLVVKSASGATKEELDRLSEAALKVGVDSGKGAAEAAKGMAEFARAGLDIKQTLDGIVPATNLSLAAQMGLDEVVETLNMVRSSFGLTSSDFGKISDLMAKGADIATLGVKDLQESFKMAGSSASTSNQTLEDSISLLALFADGGVKGSQAGTMYSAMLRDMKKANDNGSISIGKHNIALYDQNGAMRSILTVMEEVEAATANMTQMDRDAALSAIFKEESIRGVNTILNVGTGALAGYNEELKNSGGYAKEVADTLGSGLNGSLAQLNQSFTNLKIKLGDELTPVFKPLVDGLKDLVVWFTDLPKPVKTFVVVLGALTTAIPLAIGAIAAIGSAMVAMNIKINATAGIVGAIVLAISALSALVINWEHITNTSGYKKFRITLLEASLAVLKVVDTFTFGIAGMAPAVKAAVVHTQGLIDGLKAEVDAMADVSKSALEGREAYLAHTDAALQATAAIRELEGEAAKLARRKAWDADFERISEVMALKNIETKWKVSLAGEVDEDPVFKKITKGFDKGPIIIPIDVEMPAQSNYDKVLVQKSDEIVQTFKDLEAEMNGLMGTFSQNLLTGMAGSISALITGDLGIGQFFSNILDQFGDFLIQLGLMGKIYAAFSQAIKSTFLNPAATLAASIGMVVAGMALKAIAGSMNIGGSRAEGGPVNAGSAYRVGERGVEMFVPSTSGTIIKTSDMNSSGKAQIELTGAFRVRGRDLVYVLDQENAKRR